MARILFADDDLDLVEVFAEILRAEGYDVRTAVDGLDALRTTRKWRPDLAVLDVDMPRMTGLSIAAELSKDREGLATIPIVLLSGNADLDRVATAEGIPYRMTKPIAPDEFLKVLESALAHAKAREAARASASTS